MTVKKPGRRGVSLENSLSIWAEMVRAALDNPEVMRAFEQETGHSRPANSLPAKYMLDMATGDDLKFINQFLPWFNEEIYASHR